MPTFKEIVSVDEGQNQLIITVSCNKRILAKEPKEVYRNNIENLIPENLKGRVKLLSSPSKKVSNLDFEDHENSGTWVFQIIDQNTTNFRKTRATKTKTTSPRRRTTKQEKE